MRLIAILSFLLNLISTLAIANEVNIFSARHYDSDIQLYKKFTEKTGIKVNVVSRYNIYFDACFFCELFV